MKRMLRWMFVGYGPTNIAIALALAEAGEDTGGMVFVDPLGPFDAFKQSADNIRQKDMRSPWTVSVSPNTGSLSEFARRQGGVESDTPLVQTQAGFTRQVAKRLGVSHRQSTATSLERTSSGWKVRLDRAEPLETRHLVIGLGLTPHRRRPLVGAIQLPEQPIPVSQMGTGMKVAVVGAGLTAGHAAMAALEAGSQVTLFTPRGLVESEYDATDNWFNLGHEECFSTISRARLDTFRRISRGKRRGILREEARPGTMTPVMIRDLTKFVDMGQLTVREERVKSRPADFDQVLDASGYQIQMGNLPFPELIRVVGETFDGLPDMDAQTMEVGGRGSHLFIPGPLAMLRQGPVAHTIRGGVNFGTDMVEALKAKLLS